MKAAVPLHHQMAAQPAPLRALYVLEKQDIDEVCARTLNGAEKFSAVQSCVYGPLLPDEHPAIFPLFSALTEQVAVYHVARPHTRLERLRRNKNHPPLITAHCSLLTDNCSLITSHSSL